ncbi:hypothetical protein BDP81DRAFT_400344 [Colletotrichum phormii]|uniref:BZIP domain-containing protein n=1 Tax=Colletotrichum phormii TaxID=359342 RepID=A0AAI9ZD74_9PEZI|nr:uncharacterized protein BDP81DRAFT_400344 [Colletotrichum phormii]KAK1622377.1 hypothetical protein BDP81DRAFT_400344 [Colletotrichum phormii]
MPDAKDRRKRQNADAQRAYRARQKTKVRHLEQMVAAAWVTQEAASQDRAKEVTICPPCPSAAGDTANRNVEAYTASYNLTASDIYQALQSPSAHENRKSWSIMVRENSTIRDVVKYGLIVMGHSMDPGLYESALSLSSREWIETVKARCGGVDMRQVVIAGLRILAHLTAPEERPALGWVLPTYPRPPIDAISLRSMSYASAMRAIAAQLGITTEYLMDENAQSPFYSIANNRLSEQDNDSSDDDTALQKITPDLRPTFIQRARPHHPCFDLMPWPSFRSNAITLASGASPQIDEDDLCIDMLSGGVRCWGSAMGSMHGRGNGVPWDGRSWEAMPWFLEKWNLVIRDDKDGMIQTSAWWSLRGC